MTQPFHSSLSHLRYFSVGTVGNFKNIGGHRLEKKCDSWNHDRNQSCSLFNCFSGSLGCWNPSYHVIDASAAEPFYYLARLDLHESCLYKITESDARCALIGARRCTGSSAKRRAAFTSFADWDPGHRDREARAGRVRQHDKLLRLSTLNRRNVAYHFHWQNCFESWWQHNQYLVLTSILSVWFCHTRIFNELDTVIQCPWLHGEMLLAIDWGRN
jgi:hypothetical protein